MNTKKSIVVVLLAIVLALLTSIFILRIKTPSENLKLNDSEEIIIQKDIDVTKEKEAVKEEKIIMPVVPQKATVPVTSKPSSTIIEPPVLKPIQVVEEETIIEKKNIEPQTDVGIIREAGEIVITREFKSQTPSKYSFVGYGEQKAPTK